MLNKNPKSNAQKLSCSSRIVVALSSLMLLTVFIFPAWRIDLYAPQYPEGLVLHIWINKLTGDVDIINGLNHYIGMKALSNASFPEFMYLNYIVYFFIALGLLASIIGNQNILKLFLSLAIVAGGMAIYDFYQWGYSYGHHLDPKAAIQVPGMSYQPPILGHKRLLNFDAYSFPGVAGWIVILSIAFTFMILVFEWYKKRTPKIIPLVLVGIVCIVGGCVHKPEPLMIGQDACAFCKMTIMEPEYGGEIITQKNRIFKFDDISCIKKYIQSNTIPSSEIKNILVTNFKNKSELLPVATSSYYTGALLKSPMGSNTAAFKTIEEAVQFKGTDVGFISTWNSILQNK